ncbi:MAG: NAD(+) diphosphatase [Ruminiclostridium sp.]
MEFTYCPDCGERLISRPIGDEGETPYCNSCKRPFFGFSYPCVICLCVSETGEIALIKQSYVSENYVLVAGHIKAGENAEDTAIREVLEETGLTVTSCRYLLSRFHERSDCLMLGFLCRVKKGELKLSGEVDSGGWFSVSEAERLLRQGSVGIEMLHQYKEQGKL